MCDVVGRLLSSCISHLVGRRTTNTEEDTSCDPEYNTEATRYDEQPLPLSMEIKDRRDRECNTEDVSHNEQPLPLSVQIKKATPKDEFWMRTAIEPGRPKKSDCRILWKEGDEIIKRMQAERMSKDEETPSFWNYDPRCLAKEFVGLDQKSFLVDPSTFNICFLDKDILRKICKMLSPLDFLNFSYMCRFLHWRLFTFCTCYAPYTVYVEIRDVEVGDDKKPTRRTTHFAWMRTTASHRAVVARIPSCLRRPFVFDKLLIRLYFPFFTKDDFDRSLSFTLPVHKYGRHLHVDLCNTNRGNAEKFYDYQAVNDFLQAVNASSYFCFESSWLAGDHYARALQVFENCPYTRVMDTVDEIHFDNRSKWENLVLLNRIGHYHNPSLSTIIRTIEEFKYGTANLDYHEYEFRDRERKIAFLEYLFANYDEVEEYYCQPLWKTVRLVTITTKKTGRRYMMEVSIYNYPYIYIAIGKEETLNNRRTDFEDGGDFNASPKWYRMETALEPEEGDKAKTAGDNPSWTISSHIFSSE